MVGAIFLGVIAGYVAKALVPGTAPGGFLATIPLGVLGSLWGFLFSAEVLGIGDADEAFDLGGLVGAIILAVVLLVIYKRAAAGLEGWKAE